MRYTGAADVEQRRGMLADLHILLAVGQVRAHPIEYDRGQPEIGLEAVEQNSMTDRIKRG